MSRSTRGMALLAALCSGCGGDAPEPPPSDPLPAEGVFGVAPPAVRGVPSVITLASAAPADHERGPTVIDQFGLQFSPQLVIVTTGDSVVFTNSESLAHNVHVRATAGDSTVFNDDTPPSARVPVAFSESGGYRILCDTHPGMTAFVFATPHPYGGFADAEGAFHLPGVPAGRYTLEVWSLDPARRSAHDVTIRDGGATEVTVAPIG